MDTRELMSTAGVGDGGGGGCSLFAWMIEALFVELNESMLGGTCMVAWPTVKHVVSVGCQSQGSARVILTRTQWGCEEILVPRGSR